MAYLENRLANGGLNNQMNWNRKLCFEARDTLISCVDKTPNGNKYRCPDELYAYEMWCPAEVRTLTSAKRFKEEREASLFSQEMLDRLSL